MHDHTKLKFAINCRHADVDYSADDPVPDLDQRALRKLIDRGTVVPSKPPQDSPRQSKPRKRAIANPRKQ